MRSTITATRVEPQTTATMPAVTSPPNASRMIVRACRPISRNTELSSRNAMLRQVSRSAIRDCAVCRTGDLCPSSSPATTTLITPEAWISSAVTYAANGVRKLSPVSSTGSVTCLRTNPITTKNTSPTRTPPPAATRKSPCHDLPGHGDHGCRDGRVQRDQRGRVVEQRLPLEDRDDAPWQSDPATDRGRGHRVWRRDDRTDREGRPPAEVGQESMHEDRDTHRGEGDQADRQQQDRATVRVEVDQAGLERRGVQQRREQAEEHHLRLQLHVRARTAGRSRPPPPRSGRVGTGGRTSS